MRVTVKHSLARVVDGVVTSYVPGRSYDVDDVAGAAWVAAGLAVVDEPEHDGHGLEELTKAELKVEAEARGLSTAGNKADLIARIVEHDAAEGEKSAGGAPENKALAGPGEDK